MATAGFPNLFMILGPNGPFTNLPPSIETQVEWIGDDRPPRLEPTDAGWIDVKPDTEAEWTQTCMDIANQTLFPKAAGWIFGANIPGKKRTVLFYLGGMKEYRSTLAAESSTGYPSYTTNDDSPRAGDLTHPAKPDSICNEGRGMTKYATVDPTTGTVVREFATMSDADADQALVRAADAYRLWREVDLADRAAVLANGRRAAPHSTPPSWPS